MTSTDQTTDPRLVALQPFFDACEQNIKNYTLLDSQVKAAEGDRNAAVKAWMDSSTDEEAVAIREAVARATEKLRTLAEAAVGDTQVSDQEKARLKTQRDEVEKALKAGSRALRNLAEPFGIDVTERLKALGDPFLPKQSTGTGSSAPRPSVYVRVTKNNDPLKTQTFENLSSAAKFMELDVQDLGKLYAEAGVPYEEISKVKEQKEFTWQNSNLKDAPHWSIQTTPKDNSRGREAVANAPTPVVTQEPPTETEEAVA
jgi:hypothetical protein